MLRKTCYNATSRTQTYEWQSHLSSQSLVEHFECSGQTSLSHTDENMEKVCQVIHEDRQHTINNVCNILGITIQYIPKHFNWKLWQIAAKFGPHLMNDIHKQNQLSVCKDLQYQASKTDTSFLI